jgi:TonB family protein
MERLAPLHVSEGFFRWHFPEVGVPMSSDRERWIQEERTAMRRRWLLAGAAVVVVGMTFAAVRAFGPMATAAVQSFVSGGVALESGGEVEEASPAAEARSRSRRPARGSAANAESLLGALAGDPRDPAVIDRGESAPTGPWSAERPPFLGEVVELGLAAPQPARSVPARLQNRDEVVRLVRDHYPPHLRRQGFGGTVVLSLLIDEHGLVREATPIRPSAFAELDAAALQVAAGMRFTPEQRLGRLTTTRIEFPLVFRP